MDQFAGSPPVEERLGVTLEDTSGSVAVAEGCTGGLVGGLISRVPGASAYFDRAVVPYSYDSNRHLLGVTRETLDRHGVVSAPVAKQLAQRVRDMADTTWGVSTTGIAGPGGGTTDRPVGTAFLGVAYAGPWESETSFATAHRRKFDGGRTAVREQIARAALTILIDTIEETVE